MTEPLNRLRATFAGNRSEALVCYYDGAIFRMNLMRNRDGVAEVVTKSESRAPAFDDAVAEAAQKLKAAGHSVPKEASLVTPQVVSALLDLPVDPSRPRPRSQMQELIRWELEAGLEQQAAFARIGHLLVGRGYLTDEQRTQIAEDQTDAVASGQGRRERFGDLAVKLGHVEQRQLDECLLIQEKMLAVDDQIVCGWQPHQIEDMDGGRRTVWYVSGIGQDTRRDWAEAFRKAGITLTWLYPVVGSTYAALGDSKEGDADTERLLLEVYDGFVVALRGSGTTLSVLRTEPYQTDKLDEVLEGLCRDERSNTDTRIFTLNAPVEVVDTLSSAIGQPVLPVPAAQDASIGAANRALGIAAPETAVRIEAEEPGPPIWKNADFVRIAVAVVILLFLAGTEFTMQQQISSKKAHLARLDVELSEGLAVNKQLRTVVMESNRLQATVGEKRARTQQLEKRLAELEGVLVRRKQLMPEILRAVQDAINAEIVLDEISETKNASGIFEMRGWALRDTAAQLFINRLNKELAEIDMAVKGESVVKSAGPFGLDGFKLQLRMTPRVAGDRVSSAKPPVKGPPQPRRPVQRTQ